MATLQICAENGMSVKSFMDDYFGSTDTNPFAHTEQIWDGRVAFDCRPMNGSIRFSLRSLVRGKGHGTEGLLWLCGLADKHKVMLTGNVVPYGTMKPRLDKLQLKKWYERHGFLVSRNGEIARLTK